MGKMRILMVIAENQYDVLVGFAEELAVTFEQCGCMVEWLDVRNIEDVKLTLTPYKNREYDLVVAFNNCMESLQEFFIKSPTTIFWSFIVDCPSYHLDRLMCSRGNVITSFIDRNHLKYAEEELKNLSYITFMPHGGSRAEKIVPYKERNYEIVFFGSYTETSSLEMKLDSEKEPWCHIMERVINGLYDGEKDFAELLKEEVNFEGLGFSEYQRKLTLLRFRYIFSLMRNIKRIHMLEILGAAHISVEVYGNGWEMYENKYPEYIHMHRAVQYNEVLEIMGNAKIVLNNLPLYMNGSHERIFSSMCCGAVCISEENIFLREEFEEDKEIVFFNYKKLEQLPKKIKFLQKNEGWAAHIAELGRKKSEKFHTWGNRAELMLEIVQEVKIMQKNWKKDWVLNHSETDEAFNRLMYIVDGTEEELLFEKMKESFLQYALFDGKNEENMEKSFQNYPYWGKLRVRDDMFECFEQRAHQLKARINEFSWLYNRLQDETSKKILLLLLQHWLNNVCLDAMPQEYWKQYFDLNLIHFEANEVFVDCGAYCGDTLLDFLQECKCYQKVYCYEFDEKNLQQLKEVAQDYSGVEIRPCAVGNEETVISVLEAEDTSSSRLNSGERGTGRKVPMVTLDLDIPEKVTFIKMDVEGAEKKVLQGARRHISSEKPKLAVAVYHGNSDILDVPLLINEINPDYKYYLRYYGGNLYPNEIILYAI